MMNRNSKTQELKNEMAAIIIAAGYSSRMKVFKPLLPLGESTVLEHALKTFLDAGVKKIIVVLGYQGKRIEPLLEKYNISPVYNPKYDEGMYSSIVEGIKALPSHSKGFFLLPADMPLVKSSTIDALLEAYRRSGKHIIYPSYNSRRGHPPLISSYFFSKILAYDGGGGLKTLLKEYDKEHGEYVNVKDKGVILDMDYFKEYQELIDLEKCSKE